MNILALDTSASYCAVAVLRGERLVQRTDAMRKGQAEHLMPLVSDVMAEAGLAFGDLDRIGVGTGPGNFTGIRIAVSAARGLALGLGIPAVGVSTFEAVAYPQEAATVLVPGPQERYYLSTPGEEPRLVLPDEVSLATSAPIISEDHLHLTTLLGRQVTAPALPLIEAILRRAVEAEPGPRPAPQYVRPADAAPASDPPPMILS